MVTVLNAVGSRFLVFSKVRLTSARPEAERVLEPLNTRLSRFSERRWLIFCSPITQRMLSTILDLPQPLGPTMPVTLSSKLTMVLSAKLLNPLISKDFRRIISDEFTAYVLKRRTSIRSFIHKNMLYVEKKMMVQVIGILIIF